MFWWNVEAGTSARLPTVAENVPATGADGLAPIHSPTARGLEPCQQFPASVQLAHWGQVCTGSAQGTWGEALGSG